MKNVLKSQILDTLKAASVIAFAQSRRQRPESEYHRGCHDAYQHAISLLKNQDDSPHLESSPLVLFVGMVFPDNNHPLALIIDVNELRPGLIRSAIEQAFENDSITVVNQVDFTMADVANLQGSKVKFPTKVHGKATVRFV